MKKAIVRYTHPNNRGQITVFVYAKGIVSPSSYYIYEYKNIKEYIKEYYKGTKLLQNYTFEYNNWE